MTEDEKMLMAIESRLSVLESDMRHVRKNSDDRMEAIMARFDKLDRRAAWWVGGVFTAALSIGGIYLEHVLNKEDTPYVKPVVTHRESV